MKILPFATNYSFTKAVKAVASSISTFHLCLLTAFFAFMGLLDSLYLTILHYKNLIPPCTIGGCETVLSSRFATIGTVPIALIGVVFYLSILGLLFWWYQTRQKNLLSLLLLLTSIGFLIAILLVGIQAFVIHQYCLYCLSSELVDFLLFDSIWWLWKKERR